MTISRNLSFLAEGVSSTGVLGASNGGSGASTLTGYLYGNGTSAFTASTTIPTSALSGTISNAQLANSSLTINGTSISLGGSGTVTAAAGTLTGTILNSTVVSSSLTSVGTLTSGTWNASTIAVSYGGTGLNSLNAGYIPYGNGTSAFGSSSNFTFNSSTTTLTLTGGSLNAYSVYGTGGLSSTIGAINFFGASNSSVSPAVEIRQGYTSKDALTITTTAALTSTGKLINASDGTNTFVVNGGWTGNIVGIGTSSPNAPLDVTGPASGYYGGASLRIGAGTTGGTTDCWLGQYSAIIGGGGQQSFVMKNFGTGNIYFYTNNTNPLNMFSSGGVSIGNTTDPGAGNLSVNGGVIRIPSNLNINTNGSTILYGDSSQILYTGGLTSAVISGAGLHIYGPSSSGGVGPIAMVNGFSTTKKWTIGPNSGGTFLTYNDAGVGVYLTYGGTTWTPNVSDSRLKNKVSDINNALEAINKLNPLTFYYKNESQDGTPRYGHFAQDVGNAIPDAKIISPQTDDTLGDIYTYDPNIINVYLVKALQELSAKFDAYVASHP